MSKIYNYINEMTNHYENFDSKSAYETMFNFFHDDVYGFYLETIKHTLTTDWVSEEFLSHQYVLRCLIDCWPGSPSCLQTISPILPFTAHEAYKLSPFYDEDVGTIFNLDWPNPDTALVGLSNETIKQIAASSTVDPKLHSDIPE